MNIYKTGQKYYEQCWLHIKCYWISLPREIIQWLYFFSFFSSIHSQLHFCATISTFYFLIDVISTFKNKRKMFVVTLFWFRIWIYLIENKAIDSDHVGFYCYWHFLMFIKRTKSYISTTTYNETIKY